VGVMGYEHFGVINGRSGEVPHVDLTSKGPFHSLRALRANISETVLVLLINE